MLFEKIGDNYRLLFITELLLMFKFAISRLPVPVFTIYFSMAVSKNGLWGTRKPFQEKMITVNGQQVGEDAYLMQSVIDFEASTSELCPFPKESIPSLTMEQVVDAYGRVSKNKELMIVEGVELITAGFLYGLSGFDIVERLKSDFILLCNVDINRILR